LLEEIKMQVRIRETGAVMYESEFRALHPNTSMPQQLSEELLNDFGADVVFEGPQATGGTVYQYSQAQGVEQIDGKWYTKYVLGPNFIDTVEDAVTTTALQHETAYKAQKDAEQAKSVRATRDAKLAECDWTQVADAPVDKTVWATYRQALRDVTAQEGFPWTVTYPDKP
jgi:Phage tail assembly chaperone protein